MTRLFPLLTLLLTTTITLNSQEIVDPAKMWSCMEEHCQPWGSTYSTEYFRFDEDTIIEDLLYKKIWISADENYDQWNFYGAFIREENNRVFLRQMLGEEGLIYDFNLNIGDSLLVDNPRAAGELYLSLVEIDSVEITDGYRERWKLVSSNYPEPEYWIKGIGSETGVLNSSTGVFVGLCGLYRLLCEKENDELVYINPEFTSCFLVTTATHELENRVNQFDLHYDNYSVTVKFNYQINKEKVIVLSDISGKIISQIKTRDDNSTFTLLNNRAGIYIISVMIDGKLVSKKFVSY